MEDFICRTNNYVKLKFDTDYKRLCIPKNHLLVVERTYIRTGEKYYRLRYTHNDGKKQLVNISEHHIEYDLVAERTFKLKGLV
jgi:hypothetical protein